MRRAILFAAVALIACTAVAIAAPALSVEAEMVPANTFRYMEVDADADVATEAKPRSGSLPAKKPAAKKPAAKKPATKPRSGSTPPKPKGKAGAKPKAGAKAGAKPATKARSNSNPAKPGKPTTKARSGSTPPPAKGKAGKAGKQPKPAAHAANPANPAAHANGAAPAANAANANANAAHRAPPNGQREPAFTTKFTKAEDNLNRAGFKVLKGLEKQDDAEKALMAHKKKPTTLNPVKAYKNAKEKKRLKGDVAAAKAEVANAAMAHETHHNDAAAAGHSVDHTDLQRSRDAVTVSQAPRQERRELAAGLKAKRDADESARYHAANP